jgi:transcription antitermination factor NusB
MPRRRKEDGERVELFPLRRRSSVRGSRSLAREKVLQVLAAAVAAELPWEAVFEHIFYRQFTDVPPMPPRQVLSVEEIAELEADTPIQWDAEEIAFARALLQAAQQYWELAQELLAGVLLNWDLKRLVFLDRILLQLSIAEMLAMPETPVAVIIDEVVELAKRYSTERSGQFINGVLEAVYSLMVQRGLRPPSPEMRPVSAQEGVQLLEFPADYGAAMAAMPAQGESAPLAPGESGTAPTLSEQSPAPTAESPAQTPRRS